MLKVIALVMFAFLTTESHADYFITSYGQKIIDHSKPTRLLVAGSGDDLNLLFQKVARIKAKKYSEQFPNEQIVLIAVKEEEMSNEAKLANWGFTILQARKQTLDGKVFISELKNFKQILSLDIFSHSSAQFGIHLKSRTNHLNINTKGLETLRNNFMKGAFAFLHGCNSGFNLAPYLSEVWNIPVAGSLTSTNFQRLHSDGQFYLEEEGMAPSKDWSEENKFSFNNTEKCEEFCLRLKPDNTIYVGFWGRYLEGGLPFYKWFCVNNSTQECSSVMAKNLLTQTSVINLSKNSNFETYKKAVIDYLCPVSAKKDLRRECEENLDLALLTNDFTYNPFSRPQVECNFKKCFAEIKCDKIFIKGVPKPGTCSLENQVDSATTLVREYKSYLEAFSFLKN